MKSMKLHETGSVPPCLRGEAPSTEAIKQGMINASNDWDEANAECGRLINVMTAIDVEDKGYSDLLFYLETARAKRTAAGKRQTVWMKAYVGSVKAATAKLAKGN